MYIGAAHGIIGILHTLCRFRLEFKYADDGESLIFYNIILPTTTAHPYIDTPYVCKCAPNALPALGLTSGYSWELVDRTIRHTLSHYSFASGNIMSSWENENDKLVHWCHGVGPYILFRFGFEFRCSPLGHYCC